MTSLTRSIVLLLFVLVSLVPEQAIGQSVLNPTDVVVTYDPLNPPVQPPHGQIGKWVRTRRPEVPWSTDQWKAYIYKGRAFRLKFPKTYVPGGADTKKYPLMLFFHGLGEADTVTDNEWHLMLGTRFFEQSVESGVFDGYILAMQSPGHFGQSEFQSILELIEYMIINNKVDPFAITANGLSSGGQATWELTSNYPHYISTAVPMSWASLLYYQDPNSSTYLIDKIKYTPVWGSQGHLDGNPSPWTTWQMRDAFVAKGANFKLTEYPFQDHATWEQVWSDPDFFSFIKRGYSSNPWSMFGKFEFAPGEPINATIALPPTFNGYEWRKNGVVIPGATGHSITATSLGIYDARVLRGTRWSEWSRIPVVLKEKTFTAIPAKIEAENFSNKQNVYPENSVDIGYGQNMAYIEYADWMDYNINVPTAGNYTLKLRVATFSTIPNQLQVKKSDGTVLSTVNIATTGGWQNWYTVTTIVNLPAGPQTIRIYNSAGGFNLNWLEFANGGPSNAAPVTNAGTDQTLTLPVTTAQLTGNAVDTDGSIALYSWTQVSGPAGAVFDNMNAASPKVSGIVAGTYVFRLVATDNSGTSTSDEVTITVTQASNPSSNIHLEAEHWSAQFGLQTETTTDVGGGQNVGYIDVNDWMEYLIHPSPGGTYTFRARYASPGGAQIQVRKPDGTVLATLTLPSTGGWQAWQTATTTLNLAAGQQTVRIVSVSGQWNINWYEFQLAGTSTNLQPVANAGTDASITLPVNSIQLNGSGTDPDGTIVGYSWSKLSGPGTGTFSSTTVANPTVTNLSQGVYTFRLQVTDDDGGISTDDVVITVNAAPSAGNFIQAENYSNMAGVQTETTSDVNGGLNVGYIDNGDWMDYTINAPSAGVYTFRLRVASQQNGGQLQIKRGTTVLATVNVPNTGGWQTWVTINGNASLVAGVQTIRIQSSAFSSWNINWFEFVSAGNVNLPPTVNAGADKFITLPTNSVGLSGTAADPDGTIASYAWTKVSGPAGGTFSAPSSASTTVSNLQQGTYVFRLTVRDNGGETVSDDVAVTVNSATPTGTVHIEAENWSAMQGVQTEPTSDVGGGLNVGYIDYNDFMEYTFTAPVTGVYRMDFRIATTENTSKFQVKRSDGTVIGTVSLPLTGGHQTWRTVSLTNVTFTAGVNTIRLVSAYWSGFNINWLEVIQSTTGSSSSPEFTMAEAPSFRTSGAGVEVFPNPIRDRFTLSMNDTYSGNFRVQILNLNGGVHREYSLNKTAGAFQTSLSAGSLPAGEYLLRIQTREGVQVRKLIKL
jgi:predicted esterase